MGVLDPPASAQAATTAPNAARQQAAKSFGSLSGVQADWADQRLYDWGGDVQIALPMTVGTCYAGGSSTVPSGQLDFLPIYTPVERALGFGIDSEYAASLAISGGVEMVPSSTSYDAELRAIWAERDAFFRRNDGMYA